jgi:hypothetical protein
MDVTLITIREGDQKNVLNHPLRWRARRGHGAMQMAAGFGEPPKDTPSLPNPCRLAFGKFA